MTVYDRLADLLARSFGLQRDEIEPDYTFAELELDSLALVELTLAAQDEFSVALSEDDLGAESTIAQAAKVIEAKVVEATAAA
ncbi:acyl carrier protein [Kitasatospora sp. MAA4]|uniref:acyl carrier protein n=1 Tax=Kitasatospora sp. MAA4 TaxID=3035093 RepID=UPI0024735F5E|nr:phosphopantetheine-binding protein [Kitasatospora sp. MAA4]MDH6131829.1 acyl carrier protein [Kitasatospora sp. MAA4]